MATDQFKFDIRIRDRMMHKGGLSEQDVQRHIEGLTDAAERGLTVELKQPALMRFDAERATRPPVSSTSTLGAGTSSVASDAIAARLAASAAMNASLAGRPRPAFDRIAAAPTPDVDDDLDDDDALDDDDDDTDEDGSARVKAAPEAAPAKESKADSGADKDNADDADADDEDADDDKDSEKEKDSEGGESEGGESEGGGGADGEIDDEWG